MAHIVIYGRNFNVLNNFGKRLNPDYEHFIFTHELKKEGWFHVEIDHTDAHDLFLETQKLYRMWLDENCESYYIFRGRTNVLFHLQTDAVAFKLRWL